MKRCFSLLAMAAVMAGVCIYSAGDPAGQTDADVQDAGPYSVYEWAHFDDGTIPAGAHTIGKPAAPRVSPIEFGKVTGQPAQFTAVAAERGRFGLQIRHEMDPTVQYTQAGLCVGQVLNRDQLGDRGRALFQGDFFIPLGDYLPTFSLVAMIPPDTQGTVTGDRFISGLTRGFYRFSILRKDQSVGLTVQTPQTGAPNFIGQDRDLLKLSPLPGWHRFAIAFEGRETIRCYIDGREASFSPVKNSSLKQLIVGVILVESPQTPSYALYVDNLSVQVSQESSQLPESPYNAGWTVPPGPASKRGQAVAAPAPVQEEFWLDPEAAWQKAQSGNMPFLLYFRIPGIASCNAVDSMFKTDPDARSFLQGHACAAVDLNQLRGGTIAKSYQVFKAPTLLVISPDGKRHARAVYQRGNTWPQLARALALQ